MQEWNKLICYFISNVGSIIEMISQVIIKVDFSIVGPLISPTNSVYDADQKRTHDAW